MASNTDRFRRGEAYFLDRLDVQDCVVQLAPSDSLILYCGAGVTIDRTGLGWGQLIAAAFAPTDQSVKDYLSQKEIETFLSKHGPMQLASALTQYHLDQAGGDAAALREHLVPLLVNHLYKFNGWQAGRLARNVALLAAVAAALGRQVTIVTTNYDTHIEESLFRVIRRLGLASTPEPHIVVAGERARRRRPRSEDRPGSIEVLYIHGRVPRSGGAQGTLVISEIDYSQTRARTTMLLTNLLKTPSSAVLIVGASITDPPLVDALAQSSSGTSNRVALMPMESTGFAEEPRGEAPNLTEGLRHRCELLGVKLLVPDFKFQTAQFLEEVTQCMTDPQSPEKFFSRASGNTYGARLLAWQAGNRVSQMPEHIYTELAAALKTIRGLISSMSKSREKMRLELWVRDDPAKESVRQLVLRGTSTGPLFDPEVFRTAEIELGSNSASVVAFIEGRPQHLEAATLVGSADYRRRWASFLAVPIYVSERGVRVPVGTVTLASSKSIKDSALPLAKTSSMESLVEEMMRVGRELLSSSLTPV
jgi:hypothetical protein